MLIVISKRQNDLLAKRAINIVSSASHVVGQSIAVLIMVLVVADVIGRYVFNRPISGTLEVIELMMPAVVFFSFAYVEAQDGHVKVDFILSHFPKRIRTCAEGVASCIALTVFGIIAWQSVLRFFYLQQQGEVTGYFRIPISPFPLILAFGALLYCCQLIIKIISSFHRAWNTR